MAYKTRHCEHCGTGGAYHFNRLCSRCWDKLIDKNIKIHVEHKKKNP